MKSYFRNVDQEDTQDPDDVQVLFTEVARDEGTRLFQHPNPGISYGRNSHGVFNSAMGSEIQTNGQEEDRMEVEDRHDNVHYPLGGVLDIIRMNQSYEETNNQTGIESESHGLPTSPLN
jgi:hypothetical protein